jgi:hypothetical protein
MPIDPLRENNHSRIPSGVPQFVKFLDCQVTVNEDRFQGFSFLISAKLQL